MSEDAKDYDVPWWTTHRNLVATAGQALIRAAATTMIGADFCTEPRRELSSP